MSRIQPVPAKVKLGQQVPDIMILFIAPLQSCRQRSSCNVTPRLSLCTACGLGFWVLGLGCGVRGLGVTWLCSVYSAAGC
jgi:hypothetical protein